MPRDRLVLKFGGAALRSPGRVARAADRIRRLQDAGVQVVAVVSAPGRSTDRLLHRVRQVEGVRGADVGATALRRREQDRLLATGEIQASALLALALLERGVRGRGLSGPEAGLYLHQGRLEVDPEALDQLLASGWVPVVAGFQARGPGGELRTLERGGSDLTAVVLAEGLGAQECCLVKDVSGVFPRDPGQDARRSRPTHPFPRLSAQKLLELAQGGARVVQVAAAKRALQGGVRLRVHHFRSPALDPGGTVVTAPPHRGIPARREVS
ncbi:MAG: hypothetical protein EA422_14895 [Gemmatimonadales bacterium]|nr:MAG: hypothetical protein EA422_14895 [Gemmatimonadales bacterium]